MSVHTTGPLQVTADDLQITHRNRTIAIKVIDWGVSTPFLAVVERKNSAWVADYIVRSFDDRNDGIPGAMYEKEIAEDGGVLNWIKKRLIPEINATLAIMFPPGVTPPPTGDLPATLVGIDAGLQSLKWAPQADGTLRVTV